MKAPYLSHVRIDQFGALRDCSVGPFEPGLNVVFGRNEAGKTTLSSFIGGVLFGWEEARGARNAYKPEGAKRAGSLFFAAAEDGKKAAGEAVGEAFGEATGEAHVEASGKASGKAPGEVLGKPSEKAPGKAPEGELELRRVRNADGLQGAVRLVDDLDKDTYKTMFSLTSDELLHLHDAPDVTARLLTAGAGTGASPAQALATVQEELSQFTSRAASAERSLVRLTEQRDEARRAVRAAADEADRFRKQDRAFRELAPEREAVAARLDEANVALENLSACRAGLEKVDAEASSLEAELGRLHDEERRTVAARRAREAAVGRKLAHLSGAEDRALRDKLDGWAERESKVNHAIDQARSNANASRATYEAMLETQSAASEGRSVMPRKVQIAVIFALFALLVCAGVPLCLHGLRAGSLSYTSLGLVFVLFALVLAAAALVMAFKPNRRDEENRERLQTAQQAMVQDQKKLDALVAQRAELAEERADDLESWGLAEAGGSLRRARVLLDEAKDARNEMALDQQKQQAATMRATDVEQRLESLRRQKERLCERAGVPVDVTVGELELSIKRRSTERAELLEKAEALSQRWGELKQELAQARQMHEIDYLKIRYNELKTRVAESTRDFARLLLAKRMLEESIATWEAKSQPEVYERASRLLSRMTEGQWVCVQLSDEGDVRVVSCDHVVRDPVRLSLGTRQQLYLALRIALLTCASNVGRAIPVLADDILVNFDAERRMGAARALAELAEMRQVILLTCHEEVVDVLRRAAEEAGSSANVIRL